MNFKTKFGSFKTKTQPSTTRRYQHWTQRSEVEQLEQRWLLDADFGLTANSLEIHALAGSQPTQTLTLSQGAYDLGSGLTLAYKFSLGSGEQWIGANVPGSIQGAGTSDLLVARSTIDATVSGLFIYGNQPGAGLDIEVTGIRAISGTTIDTTGSVSFSGESGFAADLTIEAASITDAPGTEIVTSGTTILSSDLIILGDSQGDEFWFQKGTIISNGVVQITNTYLQGEGVLSSFGPGGSNPLVVGGVGSPTSGTTPFNFVGSGNFTFNTTGSYEFSGTTNVTGNLTLTALGDITDASNADINITGTLNMIADNITLGDEANNVHTFGSLSFNALHDVSISEDDDMQLTGLVCADNLTLTSETGSITDAAGAQVMSTSLARFVANDAGNGTITIGDVADATGNVTMFGSVSFSSTGNVTIHEDDDMTIAENALGDDNIVGGQLTLSAAGDIDNATGTTLSVTTNAQFTANNIFLGDQTGDSVSFGSFNFVSTGDVVLEENDGELRFGGSVNSVASTLSATSVGGTISNGPSANVNVTGNASFTGNSMTLTDIATFNFGSITVSTSGGTATIFEDSGTEFVGTNVAQDLSINSAGDITDATGSQLLIPGNLSLTSGGNITLADNSVNINISGSITLDAIGTVIIEDNTVGDLNFSGDNNIGGDLIINLPGGNVIDTGATTTLEVTGNASFTTLDVTLGDEGVTNTVNFGSLTFNANNISIVESSDTSVSGVNTADSLNLQSTGDIDFATTSLDVINNAFFNAVNITGTLADNLTFGSLTLAASNDVTLTEANDMVLTGTNSAVNLMLTSTGSITDSGPSSISVTGMATFTGTFVELGDQANETLSLTGTLGFDVLGDFTLDNGANNIVLKGTNNADSLSLTTTGSITDDSTLAPHELTVTNQAEFTAASITLGDVAGATPDVIHFGSLNFVSTGAVVITEDSATVLRGANAASSLVLTSSAGITDQSSTSLAVAGNANFIATLLTLGDFVSDTINLGSLTFTIAGHLFLSEDSSTLLFGDSTAGSLELFSAGDITDAATADTEITGNATLVGQNITLGDDAANDAFQTGSLTIAAALDVDITAEDSSIVLEESVTARSLQLTALTGSITDTPDTLIEVVQNASFHSEGVITLGDSGGDATNFGSLTFLADDGAGTSFAVFIDEDSATQLTGTNLAESLVLLSAGDITNANNTQLTINTLATLFADGINLGTQSTDTMNFGSILFDAFDDVIISEDSNTVLASGLSQAQNLILSSTGSITNLANTDLFIADRATFNSVNTTLGDQVGDLINLGRVTFNSTGSIRLEEDSEIVFTGINNGTTLIAIANDGANHFDITDETGVTFNFSAEGNLRGDNITIGDMATDTVNFGAIVLAAVGDVFYSEDSSTEFFDRSFALSMNIVSTGAITTRAASNFEMNVTANTRFEGTSVTIGDGIEPVNLGSLTFQSTGNVIINETDAIVLEGTNAANQLILTSDGTITDLFGTTVITQSNSNFITDGTGGITLGDTVADVYRLGAVSLSAVGQNVTLTEDDAMQLSGVIEGSNVTLTASNGTSRFDVTDAAGVNVAASGTFNVTGRNLTLANDATDTYTITGVTTLNSTGSIHFGTNATGADSGATVTLGGFGATAVNELFLAEDDSILLTGRIEAGTLILSAVGMIEDDANFDLDVTGDARLVTDGSGGITIGDQAGNTIETSRLSFAATGQTVDYEADTNLELFGSSQAAVLILESSGSITDDNFNPTSLAVTTTAFLTAGGTGDIILGNNSGDQIAFGQLRFQAVGDVVQIREIDGIDLFGDNDAASLTLTSAGAITDGTGAVAGADIAITGDVVLKAAAGISLGGVAGETTNFGRLNFESIGQAVLIQEDSNTVLFGHSIFGNANRAASLVLSSTGSITDESRTELAITGNANFTSTNAAITIGDHRNDTVNFGSLTFNAGTGSAFFDEDSSTTYFGASAAGSLVQISRGAIGNDAAADLAISGDASFDTKGVGNILLGENGGNDIDFGRLELKANGRTATVTEDSATEFFGNSTALDLILNSAGSVTDSAATEILVTDDLTITATDEITLADGANDLFWVTDQATLTAGNGGAINLGVIPAVAPAALVDSTAIVRVSNVNFNATGAVRVKNDFANVSFFGNSTANRLNLTTPGTISDSTAAASLTVADDTLLTADSILLASNANKTYAFGDLLHVVANSGNVQLGANNGFAVDSGSMVNVGRFHVSAPSASLVTLIEDSATQLTSTSYVGATTPFTAGNGVAQINLISSGSLTDLPDANIVLDGNANFTGTTITLADSALPNSLSVTGIASFTTTGGNIEVGVTTATTTDSGATVDLSRLTFNAAGGNVVIDDDSANGVELIGSSSAAGLTLTLAGALTDADSTSVNLTTATISATLIVLADDADDEFIVTGQATLTSTTGDLFLGADTRVATQFTDSGALVQIGLLNFNSAGQSSIFLD